MSNYIISARKYRPQTFENVVGQPHIVDTLRNEVKNNHLAQAYLFCGPRGVGKTTCARILAKVINSNGVETEEQDFSFNVFELDAASNNSVEDIRNLIDQVRISPQVGTHKVYIIDEVHMLSQAAFNAFLKTLEEPPKHAIFILATTEKHKIIPTILSRCQIFDFNRIGIQDITGHLMKIAEKENIPVEKEGLQVIAQKADGGLRDALSIFDQITSFSGGNVTYASVIENLNILDYDYYFKITDHIIEQNIPASLLVLDEILSAGFDGHHFINGLSSHFRDLLVCKDTSTLKLLEVGNDTKVRYQEQSAKVETNFLLTGLSHLSDCDTKYKTSKNQRLLVELTLMKLCSLNYFDGEKKKPEYSGIKPFTSDPSKAVPEEKTVSSQSVSPTSTPPQNTEPPPAQVSKVEEPAAVKYKATGMKLDTGMISLNETIEKGGKTESREETVQETHENSEAFTPEKVEEVWLKYANLIKQKGKTSFYSTLTKAMPTLLENNELQIVIENKMQEEDLLEEKAELIAFLRKELNNREIQLSWKLTKKEENAQLYTATEKFQHMVKLNPKLLDLKRTLDLDVDI